MTKVVSHISFIWVQMINLPILAMIDIAAHYGSLYRIKYGASKTKITVSGPEIDINYYKDTKPWTMDVQAI